MADGYQRMTLQSIAYAPSDWLLSVHGAGNKLGARVSAISNLVIPVRFRKKTIVSSFAHYDAVITGHNPLLAAVLVKKAVERGLSTLLLPTSSRADEWPYDLLTSTPVSTLLASLFKVPSPDGFDRVPVANQLVTSLLQAASGGFDVGDGFGEPRLSVRQPETAIAIFGHPVASIYSSEPQARSLQATFRNAILKSPRLQSPFWGQTVIFANRVLLTGLPDGFASCDVSADSRLTWPNKRIRGFGSAAYRPRSDVDAGRAMLSSLAEIVSADPF